jgi:DNA polymerase-1
MQTGQYDEIWLVDFEFRVTDGGLPYPVCMVAVEYHSGQTIRIWEDQLHRLGRAPFQTGPATLLVAYYAVAELSCFLQLGWPLPMNVLDLYTEFRCRTNGQWLSNGRGLLGALVYYGLQKFRNILDSEREGSGCNRSM